MNPHQPYQRKQIKGEQRPLEFEKIKYFEAIINNAEKYGKDLVDFSKQMLKTIKNKSE